MKYYTITELARKAGKSIPDTYKALAAFGIFPSPDQRYLTEKGKQYAQEKYVENDRNGGSYWLTTYRSSLVEIVRKWHE